MFFKKPLNPHKGFTLIELLVVISIISLLSTIAMASLNDARRKARNTQVQQEVGEWLKAIELYKDDNGGRFPLDTFYPIGYHVCLGGVHASCQNNLPGQTAVDNQSFKNSLQKYINVDKNPNRTPVFNSVSNYSVNWEGGGDVGYSGLKFISILWFLEGNDWNCAHGGQKSSYSTSFYCRLELYQGYDPEIAD